MSRQNPLSLTDIEEMDTLYRKGMSSRQIAAIYGTSYQVVQYHLGRNGAPMRSRSRYQQISALK
jgi:DNA-binding CsgD family transcriptional regulator